MEQRMAKARFQQWNEEQPFFDVESATLEQIKNVTGARKLEVWLKDEPSFASWFFEMDDFKTRSIAYAEVAQEKLFEILTSHTEEKILTAKDQINAAKLLIELADKFPTKRKEVTYLDKDVAKLSDSEVDGALLEYKKKLLPSPLIDRDWETIC